MAKAISFILIFGLIVLAHEFGHFLLGRKNGITVNEFFIGMGPTLFSFTKGGTKFSLKLLPIGGACLFEGETGNIESKDKEADQAEEETGTDVEAIKPEPAEGSFLTASVTARFSTILAGPFFNFIFAYLMGIIIVANTGIDLPVIDSVVPGSQAEAAGLMPGDVIKRINNEKIDLYRQIFFISYVNQGEPLNITYERDGEQNVALVVPAYDEAEGRHMIGISSSGEYVKRGALGAFRDAYHEIKFGTSSVIKSLKMLIGGQLSRDDVAGPVGMAVIVGDTYNSARPHGMKVVMLSMLNIAMLLSVNLGIINLLPLPALDGGRLLFITLEMLRGKPVPPEKEGLVHLVGMIALMVLMVLLLFNDISRLIT